MIKANENCKILVKNGYIPFCTVHNRNHILDLYRHNTHDIKPLETYFKDRVWELNQVTGYCLTCNDGRLIIMYNPEYPPF